MSDAERERNRDSSADSITRTCRRVDVLSCCYQRRAIEDEQSKEREWNTQEKSLSLHFRFWFSVFFLFFSL